MMGHQTILILNKMKNKQTKLIARVQCIEIRSIASNRILKKVKVKKNKRKAKKSKLMANGYVVS